MIKCPGCGAALRFDPREQLLVCDHCRQKYDPESFEEYKYTNSAEEDQVLDVTLYKCPNCGAELVSTDDTAATFCSYCGSNVMMESRMGRIEYPTRIIPFRLNKEDAEKAYLSKVKSSLFAPSDLKNDAVIDKFRGIYMPYWSYEFGADQTIHAEGKTESRRGDYIYKKHYDLSADIQSNYDGAYFDASVNFSDDMSRAIKPFETKEEKNFNAAYMSGFYADAGDVRKSLYEPEAFNLALSYMADQASNDATMSRYNATRDKLKKSIDISDANARMSLFPVWFMSMRSKNGKRINYAAVNGQTGKVAADIPIDPKKYAIFSLLLAIPLFFVLNMFLTIRPSTLCWVAIVINVIGIIILKANMNKAKATDLRTEDKAYQESIRGDSEPEELIPDDAADVQPGQKKKAVYGAPPKDGKAKKEMPLAAKVILFIVLGPLALFTLIFVGSTVYDLITENFSDTVLYIVLGAVVALALFLTIRTVVKKKDEFKSSSAIKPWIGIAFCALAILLKPVQDYWYYIAASASILLMLLSIVDIIRQYNIASTHKMPQLLAFLLGLGLLGFTVLTPATVSADSAYKAEIYDNADLLTDEEEQLLLYRDMKPLLDYGHAVFLTLDQNSTTTELYSKDFYYNHYGNENGTMFVIDMDNREIYIVSGGRNYDYITTPKAYTITDNVYTYASKSMYYLCAQHAFEQVLTVLQGGRIAEPMKYVSNALLALLISLMSSFLIVTGLSKKKEANARDLARSSQAFFSMSEVTPVFLYETKTYDPVSSGSSGGHGGGGGFSGGGGGGFSGGGGGHSF